MISEPSYPDTAADLESGVCRDYHDSDDWLATDVFRLRLADTNGTIGPLPDRIDAGFRDAAASVQVVSNLGVGFNNIDVAAATKRSVRRTNRPGVLTDSTADVAFTLIRRAGRQIGEAQRSPGAAGFKRWRSVCLGARTCRA